MSKKFTILFVCTGNTCRSAMARGAMRVLLERERPGKAHVISAGTHAAIGYPATMYAIEAAKIWDADITDHSSTPLVGEVIDRADLIFAMTPGHMKEILALQPEAASKTFLFKNFPDPSPEGEGVDDPIGQSLDRYNQTFLEIGEYLGKYLPEIVRRIDEGGNES